MSSLLTNSAAMTALQTLSATNKQMDITQNRISTGMRVSSAADNAAYWSIATTMRSDNKALGAVQDALGLGAATVDTMYTALNATVDVMSEIKAKLVAARTPGVDRGKIQSEITELQNQLKNTGTSAVFNGENWLSVNSDPTTGFNNLKSVVASFSRSGEGSVSIQTVDVNISDVKLFDERAVTDPIIANGTAITIDETTAVTAGTTTLAINGTTYTISVGAVDANDADGFAALRKSVVDQLNAIDNIYASVTTAGGISWVSTSEHDVVVADGAPAPGGGFTFATGTVDAADGAGANFANNGILDQQFAVYNGTTWVATSVSTLDIGGFTNSEVDLAQLESMISFVDSSLGAITDAATNLGAIKNRIGMQQDFVKALKDSIDRGVGQLVDADMSAESTRLQALQVQQQLGIQALSIANGNSQNILSLFR